MLLKCRYLSQFTVSEVTKNASSMSKAIEMCPFMSHARRTLTTSSTDSVVANVDVPQRCPESSTAQNVPSGKH